MPLLYGIRHAWPEQAGFCLNRRKGYPGYSFVHFLTSVEIVIGGVRTVTPNHACIIYAPGTPQYFIARQPLVHDWFHFSEMPEGLPECLDLPLDMTELFIKLSRSLSDEYTAVIDTTTSEGLRRLRSEVLLSLNHPWTVAEMAARIPLSESRFYTVYKSFYGTSPMEDLIRARIDSAKNTLLFTDRTISSIAESLGYNNLTHFIRQFRSFTGMSPSGYRRNTS